ARRVTVVEGDLHGISADRLDAHGPHGVRDLRRIETALAGHFIDAHRAGALTPELDHVELVRPAIGPGDAQGAVVDLTNVFHSDRVHRLTLPSCAIRG